MNDTNINDIFLLLERIASALEAGNGLAAAKAPLNWDISHLWVWRAAALSLSPVEETFIPGTDLLVGLDAQAQTLLDNTAQFAAGYAANNALLWGARGTGKSALVKAVHLETRKNHPALHLVEIYREDLPTLPALLDLLRHAKEQRFLLFCDDLSFDEQDSSYKSLKAVLEGGVQARPANVLLYATSNRRHLLPRNMIENERSTAIHKSESVEEKVSLSDRFGLWLGFYNIDQDTYLAIIDRYAGHYGLETKREDALEWAITRGNRSGRVAWQYILHIAGRQKVSLN
jgi:predicted AAA+ superfamily ATPase